MFIRVAWIHHVSPQKSFPKTKKNTKKQNNNTHNKLIHARTCSYKYIQPSFHWIIGSMYHCQNHMNFKWCADIVCQVNEILLISLGRITIHPVVYAHGSLVIYLYTFTHFRQNCFIETRTIPWSPVSRRSNSGGYGKLGQYQTKANDNEAQPSTYFLGCTSRGLFCLLMYVYP